MKRLAYSRTFPVPVTTAYDVVGPVPLPEILGQRHLAIPGVARVEQEGEWPGEMLGHRRTLHFSDGGRTTEVLTEADRPHAFGYRLVDVHGPMKLLISTVDGRWSFEPAGDGTDGTRITWTWELRPTLPGRVAMPAFGVMWRGMAARCFDRIGAKLDAV